MKLLVGNADLRAEAELKTVRKARGRIDIDGCAVYPVRKLLGGGVIFGDDRFRMLRSVGADVTDRIV